MIGQRGGWLWARNFGGVHSHSVTVQVSNQDIFAETALNVIWVSDEETHYSDVGIVQIVSDRGVENFDPSIPLAFRRNVTSITFRVLVMRSHATGRWMINIWG